MGLQPLEFSDCLTDSPFFRDKLHTHEKELERTSKSIKGLIAEAKDLVSAAKHLSKAQRTLSHTLKDFKFECIGSQQTADEMVIESSLREFGKLIGQVEDQRELIMLEKAYEQIISPLEDFRKKHIGGAKDGRKQFEKQTSKFNQSLEKYLNLKSKSNETSLKEADATLMLERKCFYQASMQYVLLLQEVQERKKFEFVEILLMLMYSFLTFYHQGHEVAKDFMPYMTDLQYKLQKCRGNFDVTHEESHQLMMKMLEKQEQAQNQRLREGYLYMLEKKTIGTSWTKIYCTYEKPNKMLKILPYNQTAPAKDFNKLIPETWILESCVRRATDSIEKRFCFDVTVKDKANATFTFQALSEEDRKLWMDAMGGKEPIYSQPTNSNERDTLLDEIGFTFIRKCINAIESRGLDDEGLYRVVGVASKVNKLITMGLDRRKIDKLSLDNEDTWEIKTITSALKNYFRSLPEPMMTFKLYDHLINAAKLETPQARIATVHQLTHQLPKSHFDMLSILIKHLKKVAQNSNKNLMTVPNLGVCFGPTLMRHQEETMAAIMDIKWCNIVVEMLIENFDLIFLKVPESPTSAAVVGESRVNNTTPAVIGNPTPPTRPPHMSTSAYSTLDNNPRQSLYDNHKPNISDIPKPKLTPASTTNSGGVSSNHNSNHKTPNDRMSNSVGNKSPPVYGYPGGQQQEGGETYAKYRAKLRPTGGFYSQYSPGDHNSSRSSSSESLNSRSSGTTHQSNNSINTPAQKGNVQNAGGGGGGHVAQAVNRFSAAPMQTPSPIEMRKPQATTARPHFSIAEEDDIGDYVTVSDFGEEMNQLLSSYPLANLTPKSGSSERLDTKEVPKTRSSEPLGSITTKDVSPKTRSSDPGKFKDRSPSEAIPKRITAPPRSRFSVAPNTGSYERIDKQGISPSAAVDELETVTLDRRFSKSGKRRTLTRDPNNSMDSLFPHIDKKPVLKVGLSIAERARPLLHRASTAVDLSPSSSPVSMHARSSEPDVLACAKLTKRRAPLTPNIKLPLRRQSSLDRCGSTSPNKSPGVKSPAKPMNPFSFHTYSEIGPPTKARDVKAAKGLLRSVSKDDATSSSTSSVSSMTNPTNRPRGKKVRTLYDCQAENDSELSFEPNQIILNVHNSKEPGWLEGTLEGKTGLIPANYVEYINGE